MIKQLKRRFVLITTLCVSSIIFLLALSINLLNWRQTSTSISETMEFLLQSEGRFPSPPEENKPPKDAPPVLFSPEAQFRIRFLIAETGTDGTVLWKNRENLAALNEEEIQSYLEEAVRSGHDSGRNGIYFYARSGTDEGYLVVLLDCSQELHSCQTLFYVTAVVTLLCTVLTFGAAVLLSSLAIRPVAESQQRQKRFITDASHELKTPVAIIQASVEALEITSGGNKWTSSIKQQSERLIRLVRELVFLSRTDEQAPPVSFAPVDLSAAAEAAASGFSDLARQHSLTLSADIQPGLILTGCQEDLQRLLSVLLDNAVRYALAETEIRLLLHQENGKLVLTVSNDCLPIEPKKLRLLFERFYRPDQTRGRETGGSGIGLSIAKAIVQSHGGTIRAEQEGNRITFRIVFRLSGHHS